VGSIENRLKRLEVSAKTSREEYEAALSRKMLELMTDEELRAYEAALGRAVEAGGEFTEEDQPILERAEELYKEVGREFAGAQA
jgi:hypothetical protein